MATSSKSDPSSPASFSITFQLGADDLEDFPDTKSKFLYENEMDSLAIGQNKSYYYNTLNLQQKRSMSVIELQALGGSSHQKSVS